MSTLVVVAFNDETTADRVRDKLAELSTRHLVGLEDVVVVKRNQDGKVKVKQAVNLAGAGALSGSFWGLLVGMLFWAPWLGLAVGAVSGALGGALTDIGIDDKFIKEVSQTIEPGSSAIFMLIYEVTPDKFLNEISEFKGTVIQTSMTEEEEAKLRAAFGEVEEA